LPSILVVDDRSEIRQTLSDILTRAGYAVELASNGQEAVDRYRQVMPDIMLLDMFMPVMNGFDTLFLLRQEHPSAKVIAVSGGGKNIGADALEEARNLGARVTLQKPIEPAVMLEAIETLLKDSD
jgi:two-component system chemotaxis response regulator CheY